MLLKLNVDKQQEEPEVVVTYAEMTRQIERVVTFIQSVSILVCGHAGDGERSISAADILYLESVDKKCFLYCENEVYQANGRLVELESKLVEAGFVRISKSCVLNLEFLKEIKSCKNSKLEATLTNGEKVFVSRKYLGSIREALQKRQIT